jgi:Mrp family chromosome partitioning ATPase
MENIRQAVERAKAAQPAASERPELARAPRVGGADASEARGGDFEVKGTYLHSKRIITHDNSDRRGKSYDMLRTQVLRAMDLKGWQFLAVTSPTPDCGKTLTALNLALSIARQPERSVLLVDLDFQKGYVASSLGLRCEGGVLGVLEGRTPLSSAIVQVSVNNHKLLVLPTERSTSGSAEWMASRAMSAMLKQIKKDYPSRIVIFDLPPMLTSDDVLAILPQIDCVLLVTAVGTTTISEIEDCKKHLQSADVVRVVLNKVPEADTKYYYY